MSSPKKSRTGKRERKEKKSKRRASRSRSGSSKKMGGGWFEERKLAKAVRKGDTSRARKMVKILNSKKKSLDKKAFTSSMPWAKRGKDSNLDVAIQNGDIGIVKTLLKHGARPTSESILGAVKHSQLEILKLLKEHHGDALQVTPTCFKQAVENVSRTSEPSEKLDYSVEMQILKFLTEEWKFDFSLLKSQTCKRCLHVRNDHLIKYLLSKTKERDLVVEAIDILWWPSAQKPPVTDYLSFDTIKKFIDHYVMGPREELDDFMSRLLIEDIAENTFIFSVDLEPVLDKLDTRAQKVFSYAKSLNLTFEDMSDHGNFKDIFLNLEALHQILAAGFNPNSICNPNNEEYLGDTLFSYFVEHDMMDHVKVMIRHGVDVNFSFMDHPESPHHVKGASFCYYPLMIAVSKDNLEMVKLLLKNGADPHKKAKYLHVPFIETQRKEFLKRNAKFIDESVVVDNKAADRNDFLKHSMLNEYFLRVKTPLGPIELAKLYNANPKIVSTLQKALTKEE